MKVSLSQVHLKEWQEQEMEFLRYDYDLEPTDIVLDIGSYRKEWADEIEKRFNCKVECFDALDNRAAWTKDGELEMGGQFYYTSMYEPATTRYKCVDIAPFLQREIALMKMNIEGGEYELLAYIMDKDLMKNIRELQVQFHIIEGQDHILMYRKILHHLAKTHYLVWSYPFVWENWRRKL